MTIDPNNIFGAPPQDDMSPAASTSIDPNDIFGLGANDEFSAAIGAVGTTPAMTAPGSIMDGVEAFNRSFGRLAESGLKTAGTAMDALDSILPGGMSPGSSAADAISAETARKEASLQEAQERSPIATTLGSVAGDTARALPVAIASGGMSVPGQIMANGISNAAFMAAEPADTWGEKAERGVIGLAAGGVGGFLGAKLSPVLASLADKAGKRAATSSIDRGTGIISQLLTPHKAATQSILNETRLAPAGTSSVLQSADDAAARGKYLSPGQAIGTKSAITRESEAIVPTQSLKEGMNVQNLSMEDAVKSDLLGTVDNILPDGYTATKAARDTAYNTLKSKTINADDLATLDSPALRKYAADLSASSNSDIAQAPLSNAYKLNEVRKLIGKDAYKYSTDEAERIGLKEAYADIGKVLEKTGGEDFIKANKLGQQMILKEQVDSALGKMSNSIEDTPLKELHRKLFGTLEKQKDFLNTVKTTGGDVEATKFLINDLKSLSIPSMDKLVAKPLGTKNIDLSGGNKIAGLTKFANNFINGRYNRAYARLLTENKWVPAVRELMKTKDLERVSKLKTLLDTINKSKVGTASFLGVSNTKARSYLGGK